MKNIMRMLGPETIVYVPATCLVVFGAQYPTSAFEVPYLFTAFENTGAVTTGIRAAMRRRGKKPLVVGMAGDGGTFDIGLQALSGAADRNEDIIYVCLDNEAYMNTGIQMSGATPFGAWTTTSPAAQGAGAKGVQEGHRPTSSPRTACRTRRRCRSRTGTTSCARSRRPSTGRVPVPARPDPLRPWLAVRSVQEHGDSPLAVETGMWTLYEVENGESRTTYKPKKMEPVTEYLKLQGRFAHDRGGHEDPAAVAVREVVRHYGDEVEAPVCAVFRQEEMKMHHDKDDLHVF